LILKLLKRPYAGVQAGWLEVRSRPTAVGLRLGWSIPTALPPQAHRRVGIVSNKRPVLWVTWAAHGQDLGNLVGNHVEGFLLSRGEVRPVRALSHGGLEALRYDAHGA
jgi:hypothetical protein